MSGLGKLARRLGRTLSNLRRETSGVAMTEFALALPFFLTVGLWGVELANFSVINMRVSQLAMHIADNASRIGETSVLENKKIYEYDIDDLLHGASLQAGQRLPIFERGRVIISSLEVVPGSTDDDQYIHWQRCMGKKTFHSSYGDAGDALPNGMGPAGQEIFANNGEAVIFVEVSYDYDPLISASFMGNRTINAIASFTVRTSRDLSQIYQRDPTSPDQVSSCNRFTDDFAT